MSRTAEQDMRRWRALTNEQRAMALMVLQDAASDPRTDRLYKDGFDAAVAVLNRAARPLTVKVKRDRRK